MMDAGGMSSTVRQCPDADALPARFDRDGWHELRTRAMSVDDPDGLYG